MPAQTGHESHKTAADSRTPASTKPDNIYAEMQEALFELKRDLDTYQKKIDNALVLLSIMEGRQAKRENYQHYEQQLNEIQHLISQSMDTVNQQKKWTFDITEEDEDDVIMRLPRSQVRKKAEKPAQQAQRRAETAQRKPAAPRPTAQRKPAATRPPDDREKKAERAGKKKKNPIGDILFYGILALFVISVLVVQVTSGGSVKTFMGFSLFTVKTSSMEDVYPKGSLIITKQVDADDLKVGDDITYMASETSTITHRIISIYDNYENTNERGFETQGVMNKDPDANIVPAMNVVGKVIFCSMFIGQAWAFISANWPIFVFGLVVIIALSLVLRYIFRQSDGKHDQPVDDEYVDDEYADDGYVES